MNPLHFTKRSLIFLSCAHYVSFSVRKLHVEGKILYILKLGNICYALKLERRERQSVKKL